jgi:hypothetical protein
MHAIEGEIHAPLLERWQKALNQAVQRSVLGLRHA